MSPRQPFDWKVRLGCVFLVAVVISVIVALVVWWPEVAYWMAFVLAIYWLVAMALAVIFGVDEISEPDLFAHSSRPMCDRCKGYGEIPSPIDPYALLMVRCPDCGGNG